jgi:hypothetical protein
MSTKKTAAKAKGEKAAKKTNPKGEKIQRMVDFKLTDEEKAKMGLEAANLDHEIQKITYEKKQASDEFSAKLKDRKARMSTLLDGIHRGLESRETTCIQVKNFEEKKVEFWFEGEIVQRRDLTEEDKQLKLAPKKAKREWQGNDAPEPTGTADEPKISEADISKSAEIRAIHREETSHKGAYSQLNGPRV